MDINSLFSTLETQAASPLQSERKKQTEASTETASGDTVSISDEAKELLAQMTKSMSGATASSGGAKDSSAEKDSGDKDAGEKHDTPSGKAGGSANATSSADQVKDIEAQIAKLQGQYQAIMKGSAPEGVKETQGASLQQQISALEQQLNEIKMAELQKA